MALPDRIEGLAIVSADGMIADASGVQPEALKLVAVKIERPPARTEALVAWELVTVRGEVLRAYPGACCSDLLAVVQALTSRKEEP